MHYTHAFARLASVIEPTKLIHYTSVFFNILIKEISHYLFEAFQVEQYNKKSCKRVLLIYLQSKQTDNFDQATLGVCRAAWGGD